jgi:hypothetical protein
LVENKDTKSKEGNTSRDESNLDKRQLLPTPFSFLLGLNLKDAFPAWKTCVTFVYLDKKIPVTAQNGGFMYIEQGILGPEREKKKQLLGQCSAQIAQQSGTKTVGKNSCATVSSSSFSLRA